MYLLGVHRRAQPLERLQRRYLEFQRRIMTASAPPDEEPSLDENPIQRTALASTGARTAPAVTNENIRGGNSARSAGGTRVQASAPAPQPQTRPGKMAIFSDPDGMTSQPAQQGSWSELGTTQQRNRENLREKERMTDVKIPAAVPAPTGKIQVWSDDVGFDFLRGFVLPFSHEFCSISSPYLLNKLFNRLPAASTKPCSVRNLSFLQALTMAFFLLRMSSPPHQLHPKLFPRRDPLLLPVPLHPLDPAQQPRNPPLRSDQRQQLHKRRSESAL